MSTAVIVAVSVGFALLADAVFDRDQRRRWRARARARRLAAKRRADPAAAEAAALEECIAALERRRLTLHLCDLTRAASDLDGEIEKYRKQLRAIRS